MRAKIHAEELAGSGGAALAAELGCVSADHLVHVGAAEIRALRAPAWSPSCCRARASAWGPVRARLGVARGGRHGRPGHRFQPRHLLLREHADGHRSRLPGHEADSLAGVARRHSGRGGGPGPQADVGSLEPGKWCDLLVLDGESHHELGYHFGVNLVRDVVVGGRLVVSSGRATSPRPLRSPNNCRRHGVSGVTLVECVPNVSEGRRPR